MSQTRYILKSYIVLVINHLYGLECKYLGKNANKNADFMKLGGEQFQEMLVVIHYITFIILSTF
jgi:hypothetical protein